jgi:allantoicase
MERRKVGPDAIHEWEVEGGEVGEVRISMYPDGGISRVRIWGYKL